MNDASDDIAAAPGKLRLFVNALRSREANYELGTTCPLLGLVRKRLGSTLAFSETL